MLRWLIFILKAILAIATFAVTAALFLFAWRNTVQPYAESLLSDLAKFGTFLLELIIIYPIATLGNGGVYLLTILPFPTVALASGILATVFFVPIINALIPWARKSEQLERIKKPVSDPVFGHSALNQQQLLSDLNISDELGFYEQRRMSAERWPTGFGIRRWNSTHQAFDEWVFCDGYSKGAPESDGACLLIATRHLDPSLGASMLGAVVGSALGGLSDGLAQAMNADEIAKSLVKATGDGVKQEVMKEAPTSPAVYSHRPKLVLLFKEEEQWFKYDIPFATSFTGEKEISSEKWTELQKQCAPLYDALCCIDVGRVTSNALRGKDASSRIKIYESASDLLSSPIRPKCLVRRQIRINRRGGVFDCSVERRTWAAWAKEHGWRILAGLACASLIAVLARQHFFEERTEDTFSLLASTEMRAKALMRFESSQAAIFEPKSVEKPIEVERPTKVDRLSEDGVRPVITPAPKPTARTTRPTSTAAKPTREQAHDVPAVRMLRDQAVSLCERTGGMPRFSDTFARSANFSPDNVPDYVISLREMTCVAGQNLGCDNLGACATHIIVSRGHRREIVWQGGSQSISIVDNGAADVAVLDGNSLAWDGTQMSLAAARDVRPSAEQAIPRTIYRQNTTQTHAIDGALVEGNWKGKYVCQQGESDIALSIVRNAEGTIWARFLFEARSGVSGEYLMVGTYSAETKTLRLSPTSWVSQPRGYFMVGLTAILDDTTGTLDGHINHRSCRWIKVRKVR